MIARDSVPLSILILSIRLFIAYLKLLLPRQIDSEEAYGILFYVAGALAALWISAAFVSSIDSLPVVCIPI